MRHLLTAMCACLLTGVVGVPVLAQEPSPPTSPPWFGGQRVELPEYGVAVAVPDGSAMFDMTGDVEAQLRIVAAVQGLDASDDDIDASAAAMRQQMQGQLVIGSASSTCGFTVGYASQPTGLDLDALAEAFYVRQSNDESVAHVERPEVLEMRMGDVRRVTYGRPGEEVAMYLGRAMDFAFSLWCLGSERPTDDWRSVIEGFEWLPLAVQRVRAPRTGVSIEVPATWSVNESDYLPDSTLSSSSGARFADWVMAHEVPAGQSCSISVYATDPGSDVSLDAEVAGVLADYQSESSVEVLAPETEPVRLPAGDAIRVRTIVDYDQSPDAPYAVVHEVRYFLARGPDAFLIRCSGPTPLPDRWQSIAETFEFLSEE